MSIRNLGQFQRWIKTVAVPETEEKLVQLQKAVVLDLFRRIVFKSPVGNPDNWQPQSLPPPPGYVGGRFRANWQITISAPATGEIDSTAPPVPSLRTPPFGVTVYITNNVPYAERLEMGWSRTQAPGGVVNIAIEEVIAAFS